MSTIDFASLRAEYDRLEREFDQAPGGTDASPEQKARFDTMGEIRRVIALTPPETAADAAVKLRMLVRHIDEAGDCPEHAADSLEQVAGFLEGER